MIGWKYWPLVASACIVGFGVGGLVAFVPVLCLVAAMATAFTAKGRAAMQGAWSWQRNALTTATVEQGFGIALGACIAFLFGLSAGLGGHRGPQALRPDVAQLSATVPLIAATPVGGGTSVSQTVALSAPESLPPPSVAQAARSLAPPEFLRYRIIEAISREYGVTVGYDNEITGLPRIALQIIRADRAPDWHATPGRRIRVHGHRGTRSDVDGMSILVWRSGPWGFILGTRSDQAPGEFHVVDVFAEVIADYADRQPAISFPPSQPSQVIQPTVATVPPGVAPAVAVRQPVASAVARAPRVHPADQRAAPSSEPTAPTVPAAQPHGAGSRALSVDEM